MKIPLTIMMLAAGCGQGSNGSGDKTLEPPPAGCELQAVPETLVYPSGPYGTGVGDVIEPFALDDCDGNSVSFEQILGNAELVLLNVGAGWCQPCIEETETIDQEIFRRFCGRGLRVVQVLFQDRDAAPATSLFCRDWRSDFGLSFPVLKDPLFTTSTYFEDPASQTPLNLLVDKTGTIVFREVGTPAADLPDTIESLLDP